MPLTSRRILTTFGILLAAGPAAAEWRCDCTTIVGSCTAQASAGENFIEVRSNVAQCARVDYFVDGIPFVALVVDGTERQDWIARSDSPSIIVSSCQVCLDNSDSAVVPDAVASPDGEGEATRLIGVAPVYPPEAAAAGVEGYVDIRFSVSAIGTVVSPMVVAAEPRGVFDAAAIAAVSRWRYTRPQVGESPEITERIEFNLDDEIFALAPSRTAASIAMTQPLGNSCIREESRFDFGASVDVSLVNACAEPLLVYSCAAGTGPHRDRWVCGHSEQSATVLGPTTAEATNGVVVTTANGTRTFSAAGRLEITRAPNGEYWWLACAVGDTACRDAGRQWVRTMDRQLAAVDPQNRTRARLGRSY